MTDKENPEQKTTKSGHKKKEGLFLSAEGIFHNGLYNASKSSSKILNDNKASIGTALKKPGIQALMFVLIIAIVSILLMSIL